MKHEIQEEAPKPPGTLSCQKEHLWHKFNIKKTCLYKIFNEFYYCRMSLPLPKQRPQAKLEEIMKIKW